MSGPFTLLPWDTEFFGVAIGRLTTPRLTRAIGVDLAKWIEAHGVQCVYFLADPSDAETLRLAPGFGFRVVDVRITLSATNPTSPPTVTNAVVRPGSPDDVPTLEDIARTSHRDTRFYADGRFEAQRCDDLYATWITNSCRGAADIVLVVEHERRPAGYITGHMHADASGAIGLFAVSDNARGRGNGRSLVTACLGWFHRKGVGHVSVVTQARNSAALALYQQCGFRVSRVDLWYHRWSVDASAR